ncbi:phosphoglucosamine mutase [Orbus sturtevantii]|uniref:phosphoglucosamine mutase n=1 Tax=Orbus sturtevantii TaxID=3074109 RepID=UPI00370D2ED9
MSEKKYFGTDGIRGRVGIYPITPDFALKLGWAVGRVLAQNGVGKVLIGKDTRISGYMLESALEAGFASAGIATAFTGPMPTPAIAYLTRTFRADAGVVISASHNPFYDNGIKFFSTEGKKLPDEIELLIEQELEKPLNCVESEKLGRASRITDAAGRYIEFCKGTFDHELSLSGLKVVVDCANGATYHIAPNVLKELGAKVIKIGCEPDGMNINKNCGATDVSALIQKVIDEKADVGFALDGDGDRIIMVDHFGNILDGDQIIFIIAREALRKGLLQGGVVGTLMSNMGLEIGLKELGIPFVRAKVGDRYVLEKLQEKEWKFGAENSGHVLLLDKTTTGDGIVAGLQVLSAMIRNKMTLADLSSGIKLLPQVLVNVNFAGKNDPLNHPEVINTIKEVEALLNYKGRVLIRKSGTEPLIRVMVEGQDGELVTKYAQRIADVVKNS